MRQKLEKQIEDLGPWFQNMAIAGVETAPDHFLGNYPAFKWEGFATSFQKISAAAAFSISVVMPGFTAWK